MQPLPVVNFLEAHPPTTCLFLPLQLAMGCTRAQALQLCEQYQVGVVEQRKLP